MSDMTEQFNYNYIRLVLCKKKIALKTNTMSLVNRRNLRHLRLNERSQTQRPHIIIPFGCYVLKKQIYRERKSSGCLRLKGMGITGNCREIEHKNILTDF